MTQDFKVSANSVSGNGVASISHGDVKSMSLYLPSRMDFYIDPWGVNDRGQIYSDEYSVRNTGDRAGTLIMSKIKCCVGEQGNVIIQPDSQHLRENDQKNIYMEMLLSNGDSIVMTEDEKEFRLDLDPGEEIKIRFTGEVNENSNLAWKDKDISITVTYSFQYKD